MRIKQLMYSPEATYYLQNSLQMTVTVDAQRGTKDLVWMRKQMEGYLTSIIIQNVNVRQEHVNLWIRRMHCGRALLGMSSSGRFRMFSKGL